MLTQQSFFEEQQHEPITRSLEAFEFAGKRTERMERDGVPVFMNEFWTAKQRQAHSIHEVSYRACFKPQLPNFFITRLTLPGDTVYDPFMGRGTTPIEAALLGRNVIGNDINPLSTYLARPRITPPSMDEIAHRLSRIPWNDDSPKDEDLLTFYHPGTLEEIYALRAYLLARDGSGELDPADDWIRMVAINRLTGHSSGFLSVYSLPPNQAVSVAAQRKINERRKQAPAYRKVSDVILKKTRSLFADGRVNANVRAGFYSEPSHHTPNISTGSVDLVVTSPPFLDVVQYASDNWLRTWFAGIDADAVDIAMHRKPDQWIEFVRSTFVELGRVVRPGGHVAFEVGEVRNATIELEQLVLLAVDGLPFRVKGIIINIQEFTKTANCWGVRNNKNGTNTNRIVLLERQ